MSSSISHQTRNVVFDYEIVFTGSVKTALAEADKEIARCVSSTLSEDPGILGISSSGQDYVDVDPFQCMFLKPAEGTKELCKPAVGVLLAKYDLNLLDYDGVKEVIADAVSECLDNEGQVVSSSDTIVRLTSVDRNPLAASLSTDVPGSPDSPIGTGAIAGIAVGCACLALLALLAARRSRNNKSADEKSVNGDDLATDIEADKTFETEKLPSDPATASCIPPGTPRSDYLYHSATRESEKQAMFDELDDVVLSIENDMSKVKQGGEDGDEFEVAL